jgi:hypothetical protein
MRTVYYVAEEDPTKAEQLLQRSWPLTRLGLKAGDFTRA